MNRNRKIKVKSKLTASVAAGMAAVIGAVPVLAAGSSTASDVYKEETVYVNADASGKETSVIVSDWLKNAGSQKTLKDSSDLTDIENVKGDETWTSSGSNLTWTTEGNDIYYQGNSNKELPVNVHFTYYLDGKKTEPADLVGKSGHLKIEVSYENTAKKTVEINGKKETVYSPFVMVTGMILPDDTFSNVTIDNGKVISDGNRSIVLGVTLPGLKESLGLDSTSDSSSSSSKSTSASTSSTDSEADSDSVSDKLSLNLPESLEINADVENFSMDPTFTVGLSDILDSVDTDNISDVSDLMDSLDDLEDAALQLVSGSQELFDGASTLNTSYGELDTGIGTLKSGIDAAASGVGTLADGIVTYTNGTAQLSDGILSYVSGEEQLAAGAAQLQPLVSGLNTLRQGTALLNSVLDGEGSETEDLKVASEKLAAGSQQLKDSLDQMSQLLGSLDSVEKLGSQLISGAKSMSSTLQSQVAAPLQNTAAAATKLKEELTSLQTSLQTLIASAAQSAVDQINGQIDSKNQELQSAAGQVQQSANEQLSAARAGLQEQIDALDPTTDAATIQTLQAAMDKLGEVTVTAPEAIAPIDASSLKIEIPQEALASLNQTITDLQTAAQQLSAFLTNQEFAQQLQAMEQGLETLSQFQVPTDSASRLQTGVSQLNAGMQALNTAIGTLSDKVGGMYTQTASLPQASAGLQSLLNGFDTLSAYNSSLTSGASTLTGSNSQLIQGVQSLQSGASQLSSGASSLQSGSSQVKEGISQLTDGAKELKEGTEKFNKEGIEKLTSTLKDTFSEVVDRIKALTSDDCSYDTYSGRAEGMDGNVKFVIETESIK